MDDSSKRLRIHLMDELRGFAVLCMVFYHGFYTLAYLVGLDWGMALLRFFMPAEPFFAGLFILISGISSNLSRSNLKRGIKLLLVAVVVSAATMLVVPDERIVFGVLHFLSVSMILFGLVKPWTDKLAFSWLWVAFCAVLTAFTWNIQRGYLGFQPFPAISLPTALYQTDWLMMFGLHSPGFFSSDYFPLFPWLFIFFAGTFLGKLASAGKFPAFTYPSRVPALSWMGRNALIIYVVHQPVIYGVSMLITLISGS